MSSARVPGAHPWESNADAEERKAIAAKIRLRMSAITRQEYNVLGALYALSCTERRMTHLETALRFELPEKRVRELEASALKKILYKRRGIRSQAAR